MIDFLSNIDNNIFLFFNGMHTEFLDRFMMIVTGKLIWAPLYLTILLSIFRAFRPKAALIYLLALGVAIALTDQTCAHLIRPMVERLRPSNLANPLSEMAHIVDGYRGGSYGFPSCHAANSFALAVFVSMMYPLRKVRLLMFGWALLNSYSRLYLGVHYPGDLFVGAVIGSMFGYLCCMVANYCNPESHREVLGRLHRPLISGTVNLRLPLVDASSDVAIKHVHILASIALGTVFAVMLVAL